MAFGLPKAALATSGGNGTGNQINAISMPLPASTYRSRTGSPKIIVLHSTEGNNTPGTGDLGSLGDVLKNEGLSVHLGVDAEGNVARYVNDEQSAFHVADFNDIALGIEQVGHASQTSWPKAQTDKSAAIIAYWAKKYNIPITHSTSHGVCTHKDLGAAGGGHQDPGAGYPFANVLQKASSLSGISITGGGAQDTSGGGGGSGGGASGGSTVDPMPYARAGALSNSFELPGIMNYAESSILTGSKALMNDTPLIEFIQQLCTGSLRDFQSLPNGTFFAFFPDRFGLYNARKPYWDIYDIEIMDGKIDLGDETLFTHVYSVGDTISPDGETDMFEKVNSRGTVTIFDALAAGLIKGKVAGDEEALNFLKRYGARPFLKEAPMVRNYIFEVLLGITEFQKAWASQFSTMFTFTFMPELFPGGIVRFPDHNLQCYIESVVHEFDYESGFNTQAELSSPAASADGDYSTGMIVGS